MLKRKPSQESSDSLESSVDLLDHLHNDTSSAIQRALTAKSPIYYSYHSSQQDRQRETPTSEEIRTLFAPLEKNISTQRDIKKMRKEARRIEDQEAREQALNDGILTQLSYPASLFSSSDTSLRIKTPSQSQTSEGEATLSQLEQEEADLLKCLASSKKQQVPLDGRRLYADSLRVNLEKQASIAAKQTSTHEESTQSVAHESPSLSF